MATLPQPMALLTLLTAHAAATRRVALPVVHRNISSAALCASASDVCSCAALAPGCGWCSSQGVCAPADRCTLTCRECPTRHDTCRSSCRRACVDTCSQAKSVCGCTELAGCGWCSHGQTCTTYPECSTTCEECDESCSNYKHCKAKCYPRFRPRTQPVQDGLFPLGRSDTACAIAVFFATVFASAAGIGGGAVLVPLFTLIGEFSEHEAIPLALSTVFGASLFSTFGTYIWEKHPIVPHRPRIAYDVVTVLMPATLLGTTTGVFLNKICPNWLIMLLLVGLCGVMGKRTLEKARAGWAKESRALREYATVAQADTSETTRLVKDDDDDDDGSMEIEAAHGEDSLGGERGGARASVLDRRAIEANAERLAQEHAEEAGFQWRTALELMRAWVAVFFLALLKGGHGAPSLLGVKCGSLGYWTTVSLNIPVLALLTWLSGRARLRQHERRVQIGYKYVEGDVQWDLDKVVRLPLLVCVGAIAAGMLGVGGGMILGPIFTELGFLPEVTAASSTLMVLFMSSATVGQFIIFGMIDTEYALFFGICGGVLGAIVGTKGAGALLRRTGRASIIVFFLAFILFGSGILMVSTGSVQLLETGFTGFRPVCGRTGKAAQLD